MCSDGAHALIGDVKSLAYVYVTMMSLARYTSSGLLPKVVSLDLSNA